MKMKMKTHLFGSWNVGPETLSAASIAFQLLVELDFGDAMLPLLSLFSLKSQLWEILSNNFLFVLEKIKPVFHSFGSNLFGFSSFYFRGLLFFWAQQVILTWLSSNRQASGSAMEFLCSAKFSTLLWFIYLFLIRKSLMVVETLHSNKDTNHTWDSQTDDHSILGLKETKMRLDSFFFQKLWASSMYG